MSAGFMKKCSSGDKPKQRHETRQAAEAQRTSLVKLGRWTMAGSNTYLCNACGFYHAGSLGKVNRGSGRKNGKNQPRRLDCQ